MMKLIATALLGATLTGAPYPPTPPTSAVPTATPEGQCLIVGIDTQQADPTMTSPDGVRVIGITVFISHNPSSANTSICALRIEGDVAERLVELATSMTAEAPE